MRIERVSESLLLMAFNVQRGLDPLTELGTSHTDARIRAIHVPDAGLMTRFPYLVRVGGIDDDNYADIVAWLAENGRGHVVTNFPFARGLSVWETAFGFDDAQDAFLFRLRWGRAFPLSPYMTEWA